MKSHDESDARNRTSTLPDLRLPAVSGSPDVVEPYFSDQDVTLYLGDAAEILPLLGAFDAVVTDPP